MSNNTKTVTGGRTAGRGRKLSAEQKVCARACDLLVSLSSGQLERARKHHKAIRRDGSLYHSSTICVSPTRIAELFDALEAAYPGLYLKVRGETQ